MLLSTIPRIFSFSSRTFHTATTVLTSHLKQVRMTSEINKNGVINNNLKELSTLSKDSCIAEKRTSWTFDHICTHMEYTPFPNLEIFYGNDMDDIESYDLVLVGVFGPDDINSDSENDNTRNKP